jgi:RNA 3'-terminal phosphate cyclase
LLGIAALPRDVQPLNLPHAHALATKAPHERLALAVIGPGQRHQELGRRLHRERAGAHHLLHRLGQRAHQRKTPAHPARRPVEAARELLLTHSMSLAQLAQQPSFFEGRACATVVEPVAEHERLGLGHVHRRRVDQVARELAQRRDAHVAVDEHPRGAVAHHEHRRLLAMLEQRSEEESLA